MPYFKLMYGDLIDKSVHLNISWSEMPSKKIYNVVLAKANHNTAWMVGIRGQKTQCLLDIDILLFR